MLLITRIKSVFRTLFRSRQMEQELDEELKSWIDIRMDRMIADGMPARQARRMALLELGGVEQVKMKVRENRVGTFLDTMIQDLRISFRMMRKDPGFALVAIVILALGIGATSAIFSLVDRQLPFEEPDRLVMGMKTIQGEPANWISRVDYYDFNDLNRSFEELAAVTDFTRIFPETSGEEPVLMKTGFATWNLLPLLGVEPIRGRGFRSEDAEPGAVPTILVSHRLWMEEYGGATDLVGSTLTLSGTPCIVIGVLPRDYRFLVDADVWWLIDREGPWDQGRGSHSHMMVGRLLPDVTMEQAGEDLSAIAAELSELYPETNDEKGVALLSLRSALMFNARPVLLTLLAATVLVLLIACGNVAGLLLARGQVKLPELSVRSALGATRSRLIRLQLTESLLIAGLAGLLGVVIARVLLDLLLNLLPGGMAGLDPPAIGSGVLLFTIGVSIVTGLFTGLIPAVRSSGAGLTGRMNAGSRVTEGARSTRLRSSFVIAQVTFSVVLLVVAGLLINNLVGLARLDLGFDPDELFICGLQVSPTDYSSVEELLGFLDHLLERIQSLPGVESATIANKVPAIDPYQDWGLYATGRPPARPVDGITALARWAPPGYFSTVRMPLLRGRDFEPTDTGDASQVIILSEDTAETLFPDSDPLGQLVTIQFLDPDEFRVIGIVGDGRLNGVRSAPYRAMYMPFARQPSTVMRLIVRAERNAIDLAGPIRNIVRQMDRIVLMVDPTTVEAGLDEQLGGFRIAIIAMSLFAVLALVLTAIGLYGVLAYHVRQRTNEIGLRVCLGATGQDIITSILRQGFLLAGIGLALGIGGAMAAKQLLSTVLSTTGAIDITAWFGALLLFAIVVVIACLVPALRTLRIDPVKALRIE
ncbi:ADOP family duplicated permease [Candidatus Zixiibacteriota bacterium]